MELKRDERIEGFKKERERERGYIYIHSLLFRVGKKKTLRIVNPSRYNSHIVSLDFQSFIDYLKSVFLPIQYAVEQTVENRWWPRRLVDMDVVVVVVCRSVVSSPRIDIGHERYISFSFFFRLTLVPTSRAIVGYHSRISHRLRHLSATMSHSIRPSSMVVGFAFSAPVWNMSYIHIYFYIDWRCVHNS